MSAVIVENAGDRRHVLEALEGRRQMEIVRDWGLPIGCECGGACSCATCHVEVAAQWRDRLLPPTEEEEAKLDELATVTPNTRLACQILWDLALDGLRIRLPERQG
jgi:2Fe-2S ferredoxin